MYFANQIIDRLPLSVDSLKTSKLGKIVIKLVKDSPTPGERAFHALNSLVSARDEMKLHSSSLLHTAQTIPPGQLEK